MSLHISSLILLPLGYHGPVYIPNKVSWCSIIWYVLLVNNLKKKRYLWWLAGGLSAFRYFLLGARVQHWEHCAAEWVVAQSCPEPFVLEWGVPAWLAPEGRRGLAPLLCWMKPSLPSSDLRSCPEEGPVLTLKASWSPPFPLLHQTNSYYSLTVTRLGIRASSCPCLLFCYLAFINMISRR